MTTQTSDDSDAGSIYGFTQSTITDATTDANSQDSGQDTFWGQVAQATVTATNNLNSTVGSPLTEYLVARAGAEQSWTNSSLIPAFNTYAQAVLGSDTGIAQQDSQAAKSDALSDDTQIDLAIHDIAGDLLADTQSDLGDMLDDAGSLATPINNYGHSVANARSQFAIAQAAAQHDYDLGGSQASYSAALATAGATQSSALSAAAVDYALAEIGPDAKDTGLMASSDLSAAQQVDARLYLLQTTVDDNDLAFDLQLDNNDQSDALTDALAAEAFQQTTSTSYDAALDALATSNPSPYATQGAAVADAQNTQSQAGAVAQYNQAVATADANLTLATATDTATANVNNAQALAAKVSSDASALAAYNQDLGQIASLQATAAGGGSASSLPQIASALGLTLAATTYTEVAGTTKPGPDNFGINTEGAAPSWVFYSTAPSYVGGFYGNTISLTEGLQLDSTINAVEHPSTPAVPAGSNAAAVVKLAAASTSSVTTPQVILVAQGGSATLSPPPVVQKTTPLPKKSVPAAKPPNQTNGVSGAGPQTALLPAFTVGSILDQTGTPSPTTPNGRMELLKEAIATSLRNSGLPDGQLYELAAIVVNIVNARIDAARQSGTALKLPNGTKEAVTMANEIVAQARKEQKEITDRVRGVPDAVAVPANPPNPAGSGTVPPHVPPVATGGAGGGDDDDERRITSDIATKIAQFEKKSLRDQRTIYNSLFKTYNKHLAKYGQSPGNTVGETNRMERELAAMRRILEERGRTFGVKGNLLD